MDDRAPNAAIVRVRVIPLSKLTIPANKISLTLRLRD